jgi:LPXTG-motif cell wall-anchored protein
VATGFIPRERVVARLGSRILDTDRADRFGISRDIVRVPRSTPPGTYIFSVTGLRSDRVLSDRIVVTRGRGWWRADTTGTETRTGAMTRTGTDARPVAHQTANEDTSSGTSSQALIGAAGLTSLALGTVIVLRRRRRNAERG